jgi:hypothetical protein
MAAVDDCQMVLFCSLFVGNSIFLLHFQDLSFSSFNLLKSKKK